MATEMIKTLNAPETRGIKMAAGLAEEILRQAQQIVVAVAGAPDSTLTAGVVQAMAVLYGANLAANR
jgi:hypothetical protein